jgi:hypothetical protein
MKWVFCSPFYFVEDIFALSGIISSYQKRFANDYLKMIIYEFGTIVMGVK